MLYDFSRNQCVILNFPTIKDDKFINKTVKNFDENHVVIPGDEKKNIFIVSAAIVYIPNDRDNTKLGGHYVCWRRSLGGHWNVLSDTNSTNKTTFIKNLNGVYLLFLQKKVYA